MVCSNLLVTFKQRLVVVMYFFHQHKMVLLTLSIFKDVVIHSTVS